jgi:hypothetical protein
VNLRTIYLAAAVRQLQWPEPGFRSRHGRDTLTAGRSLIRRRGAMLPIGRRTRSRAQKHAPKGLQGEADVQPGSRLARSRKYDVLWNCALRDLARC